MRKPIIGITIGDVAGIGPEIIRKALRDPGVHRACVPVVIGNLDVRYPKYSAEAGEYAMRCVRDAVGMIGSLDAIVTVPLCKEGIHKAGYRFYGHTDYLAYLTGTKEYSMMLVSPKMRVVLVTIHVRLKDVRITKKGVLRAIGHAYLGARLLGIKKPRVGVCALNPHGGETGDEEKRFIIPAVRETPRYIGAEGPFPADTIFLKRFDVFVAMYHDQGLIPLKLLGFREGVNVTLGLPFIRTSPDHGTAYEIAGKNKADPTSMIRAIKLAARMWYER